jgi:hypothetical protein
MGTRHLYWILAGPQIRLIKEDYIGRKKTILMTSRHLRLSKLLQTKMVISTAAEV